MDAQSGIGIHLRCVYFLYLCVGWNRHVGTYETLAEAAFGVSGFRFIGTHQSRV